MGDFRAGFLFFVFSFSGFLCICAAENKSGALGASGDPFAVAMGGGCTALNGRPSILLNNPASIAAVYQHDLFINHAIFASEINSFGAGFALPLRNGVLALSRARLDYEAPGSFYENSAAAAYALSVGGEKNYGALGVNFKYEGIKLANYNDESLSADLGAIYNIPFVRGASSAVVYKNIGAAPLMRSTVLGLAYSNLELVNAVVAFDAYLPSEGDISYSGGVTIYPVPMLRISAGWKETDSSGDWGPRAGAGFDFGGFEVNYSLSSYNETTSVHSISITISLDTVFSPWAASDYSLRRHMQRAGEFYLAKNYIQARHELENIISLYPDYIPAHELLGKVGQVTIGNQYKQDVSRFIARADDAFTRNDLLSARRYYNMVIALDPENMAAKSGSEKVRDAILEMQQAKVREENRGDINKIWKEAILLYTRGEYINSKEKFLEIIAIDPKHKPTQEYIVEIDNQLAKITAAQVNEMFSAGAELYKNGKYNEAIRYFEAVVIAAPHRLDAEDFIARCRQMLKEGEEKLEQERLAKRQERMKNEVETSNNRAVQYLSGGDYVLALEWFKKTEDIASRYEFKQYYEEAHKQIDVIKVVLADKHYRLGFDFYQKNRFESAFSEYRKSLQYNPENVSVKVELDRLARTLSQQYYEQGMSFYTQGQIDKAKEYIEKSLSYKPDKEESLRALERMK